MSNETNLWSAYKSVAQFGNAYAKIHPFLVVPVCVLSLLTNVLNSVVLSKKELRSATNCLLQTVAVCHLALNTFYLGTIIHDWYYIVDDCPCDSHIFTFGWTLAILLFSHLAFTLHGIGTWLTVAMALLRCIQLKTRDSSYTNTLVATKIIVGVVIVVTNFCVPNYLAFSVRKTPIELVCPSYTDGEYYGETFGWVIGASQISSELISHPYKMAFQLSAVLFYLIPCCLLIVSFGYLVSTLSKFNRTRRRLQQTTTLSCVHTEHQTLILVSILTVFFVTQLPQGILTFLCSVLSEDYRLEVYQSLGQVMELLSIINGLFGFILYCSMSTVFRSSFMDLFRRVKQTAACHVEMSSLDNVGREECRQCRHPVRITSGCEKRNKSGRCRLHAAIHITIVGHKRGRGYPV